MEDLIMRVKTIFQLTIIVFIMATLILSACDKKSSNPVSYVDGYQPDYNEEKGTSYTGNFFPVAEGKEWHYSGSMEGTMKLKMKGSYYGQNFDTTMVEPMNYPYCVAVSKILRSISATLGETSYTLFPEEQYADLGMESAYTEIVRYYEVTDSVVYIRAVPGDDGLVKVTDPVFVKSNLIVGDNWSSNPTVNTSDLMGEDDEVMELNAECKLFVVGMDTVAYYINGYYEEIQAMQLDEVAEFSGTLKSEEFGDTEFKMSGKVLVHFYLVEDIGIVAQLQHIEISMNGKISDSGGTITINIDMDIDTDLSLSSYSGTMAKSTADHKNSLFKKNMPVDIEHLVHKAARLVNLLKP